MMELINLGNLIRTLFFILLCSSVLEEYSWDYKGSLINFGLLLLVEDINFQWVLINRRTFWNMNICVNYGVIIDQIHGVE